MVAIPTESNERLKEYPRTHVSIDSNQVKREVGRRHYEDRTRGGKDITVYYHTQKPCQTLMVTKHLKAGLGV